MGKVQLLLFIQGIKTKESYLDLLKYMRSRKSAALFTKSQLNFIKII